MAGRMACAGRYDVPAAKRKTAPNALAAILALTGRRPLLIAFSGMEMNSFSISRYYRLYPRDRAPPFEQNNNQENQSIGPESSD